MPFFFLYLYGNNNIMAKTQNDGLNKGVGLLKDQVSQVGYLDEAFKSLAEQIQNAFSELSDSLEGNLDITEKIAKSYERDVVGSINKMVRSLERNISLQDRVNKGQNVSKQIEKERGNLKTRFLKTEEQINKVFGKNSDIANTLVGQLSDAYETQKENLTAIEDSNKKTLKSVSLYKILGDSLGGMVDKLDKSGTLSGILKGNFKEVVTTARMGQVGQAALAKTIIDGIIMMDEMNTQAAKSFGLSDKAANSLNTKLVDIAVNSNDLRINAKDTSKAFYAITEATGILSPTFTKVVDEAAQLMKFMGLTGEQAAALAMNSLVTGQNIEDQTISMVKGARAAEDSVGVTLDLNKVFKDSANVTGLIRANLGRNLEVITKTVGEAQALGLTLQDLAGISSNLLNFQSSIEAELTAELFTGKQLNLEKARLYALTGDYNNLQKEIIKNAGSEYEFLSMNVLAKEKYAAALGMSVDQMSNLVMKNKDLSVLEQQARDNNNLDLADQLKSMNLQQEFNALIEKLQTIFVSLASGPLGDVASLMSGILQNGYLLYPLLGAIAGIKLLGLVTGMLALATAAKTAAVSSMAVKFAMNPVAAVLTLAALGGGLALMSSLMKKEISKPLTPFLEGGKVGETGAALVHKDEIIVPAKRIPMNFFQEPNTSVQDNTARDDKDRASQEEQTRALNKIAKNTTKPWAKWEVATLYR